MRRLFGSKSLRNPLLLGAGSFLALMTLEIATEEDALSVVDLGVDAVTYLLIVGSAVGVGRVVARIEEQEAEKAELLADLAVARAEGEDWRARAEAHIAGLHEGLMTQFRAWELTPAETEVGMLILKGLSHREIAALRDTSEATVRQQAQAIYRKAGLPGKTAFSAYFLEDLFSADEAKPALRLLGE